MTHSHGRSEDALLLSSHCRSLCIVGTLLLNQVGAGSGSAPSLLDRLLLLWQISKFEFESLLESFALGCDSLLDGGDLGYHLHVLGLVVGRETGSLELPLDPGHGVLDHVLRRRRG
jgi:hypothetical protein